VLGATVGRAFRLLLTGFIVGYRRFVSPLLGPRCRFYPSCSAYGLEAIATHGAAKGTVLTVARVCRCNPWNAGGVDHVPARGTWKSEPYVSLESHDRPTTPTVGVDVVGSPRPVRSTDDRSAA
jgi:putative membrane protein insertion efficiency factor